MATMASTTGSRTGWAELPADLLGCVVARLPSPGDRAAICASCRSWRSAARRFVRRQPPWIVLPDCTFCTTGHDGGAFFGRIPGLPAAENATCLAAAGEGWLALDLTDDALRRTPFMDTYCPDTRTFRDARPDVKHSHTYLLHNPFTNVTVPLPELDSIVGDVAETFEIRKVLMRSATDDVIAVTTSDCKYNVILCKAGKGTFVLPNFRVIDIAFVGDTLLYGITSGEELLAFHLAEDEDGRPKVTRFELVIKNPMAAYYYDDEFPWSWPQIDDDSRHANNDCSTEAPINQQNQDDNNEEEEEEENYQHQEAESDDEHYDDDDVVFNGDGAVSDNEVREEDGVNREVPYDATDETYTARYLVRSLSGELLLVRHGRLSSPYSYSYTLNVEVFKADLRAGKWVPANGELGLGEGEALFLSRSFSKSTRAHGGDVKDGFVYYAATIGQENAFDTRSRTIQQMALRRPWQWEEAQDHLLTWLFPPELVV
ncbi:unnamed protein product [Urochloa decumbens]|uniref:KIB1-4 beta-propeller domain-containing protein n=1 Tax=Urochloa decumbens TaxID=240449 RepID=A0ABC9C0G5_9POAL